MLPPSGLVTPGLLLARAVLPTRRPTRSAAHASTTRDGPGRSMAALSLLSSRLEASQRVAVPEAGEDGPWRPVNSEVAAARRCPGAGGSGEAPCVLPT